MFDLARRGQLFGERQAGSQEALQRRQQLANEALQGRQIPFQEMMALFGQSGAQYPDVLAPPPTGLTSYAQFTPGGAGAGGGIGSAIGALGGAGLGALFGGLPGAQFGAGLGGGFGGGLGSLFG